MSKIAIDGLTQSGTVCSTRMTTVGVKGLIISATFAVVCAELCEVNTCSLMAVGVSYGAGEGRCLVSQLSSSTNSSCYVEHCF